MIKCLMNSCSCCYTRIVGGSKSRSHQKKPFKKEKNRGQEKKEWHSHSVMEKRPREGVAIAAVAVSSSSLI